MDIKNLIIALLVAALGVTALEATNVIDLLNNNGSGSSLIYQYKSGDGKFEDIKIVEPKVKQFIQDDVAQYPTKPNPAPSIDDEKKGIYISYGAITKLIMDEQIRVKSAGSTEIIEGIVIYPYRENDNRVNASLSTSSLKNPGSIASNPIFLTGESWCPPVCGSIK